MKPASKMVAKNFLDEISDSDFSSEEEIVVKKKKPTSPRKKEVK